VRRNHVSLTSLECKALWILAEHGASFPPLAVELDPELQKAGERAVEKIWRLHMARAHSRWLWFWPFGRTREVQTSAE
jgi:hypothetical protein